MYYMYKVSMLAVCDGCLLKVTVNETHIVCLQIFTRSIFHERPAPDNFCDFNFANGGLQLQTCTVCVQIFEFSFSQTFVDS